MGYEVITAAVIYWVLINLGYLIDYLLSHFSFLYEPSIHNHVAATLNSTLQYHELHVNPEAT